MDKIIVNNQVVLMRKFVKQAKTHIINKCAKRIKALQSKKGNEDQMLKYKRKVERLIKEIVILKNMKLDLVSKLALSKAKDWESVLKQKNLSLEERCLSMLANYAAVKKEVDKFHFNKSHLVSKIPGVILEWEAKSENCSTVKQNKMEKFSKYSEFKNASFPNNIKVAKRTETAIRNKPMLPHLASNSTKLESKQFVKQHTVDDESIKPDVQSKITFKDYLNKKNKQSLKKEKPNKLLRKSSDNELSEEVSKNFQLSNVINNENKDCLEVDFENFQSPNITDNENKDLLEEDSMVFPSLSVTNNEVEELLKVDSKNFKPPNFTKNEDKKAMNETSIFKRKKQKLSVSKNKHIASHGVSDVEMHESDENSNHQSEVERTKKFLNDKHIYKQLDVKKYLYPLKSTPKNISMNNQSTIFSKLEAISHSDFTKPNSYNTKQKNTKAITVLDLNKLQDLDEIPLEKSPDVGESSDQLVTHKSDSFFLTADDSINEESKGAGENMTNEMPFKDRRRNINKRISDSNFREKLLKNKPSYKSRNDFKGGVKCNMKRNEQFWEKSKDSKFDYKNELKLKKREAFSGKNQFEKKRNLKPEMRKPSNKNQNKLVSKNFHQDKANNINKEAEDKKPIHPSWEAKQKLKETLKIGFQGKRVVFD